MKFSVEEAYTCSTSWIPNFIDFLNKVIEWQVIEGKRLIKIIFRESVPFSKIRSHMNNTKWRALYFACVKVGMSQAELTT